MAISPQVCYLNYIHTDIVISNLCKKGLFSFLMCFFGSFSYIENAYLTKLNEKCDIYSFGVVLLEILCRKLAIDSCFEDEHDIVSWVRAKLQDKSDDSYLFSFLDEEIEYWEDEERIKAVKLLELALSCTQFAYEERPSMRQVVRDLFKING